MQVINIFIAESNHLAREGIKAILTRLPNLRVSGEAKTRIELKNKIAYTKSDVVILAISEDSDFSLEDVLYIQRKSPLVPILILAGNLSISAVLSAVKLNIQGYLLNECEEAELRGAIQTLARNEKYFCAKVVDIVFNKHKQNNLENTEQILSQREMEVLKLFAEGHSAKEIAGILFLSHHTINTHRKNILKKLNLNSTTELILHAIRFGAGSLKNKSL